MSDLFENLAGINLSDLDQCEILDANNENIGRLIDAVLTKTDEGMKLTKFVVGDSKLIEFLERIKLRPDIDPVFETSTIASVSPNQIKLNVAKNKLKATHVHDDVLTKGEYKLSQLRKIPVIDSDDVRIGRVIDLTFDKENFQLILGDSPVKEWAESVGLQPDVDFLIAPEFIEEFGSEKIKLTKPKSELKSTFMVDLDSFQGAQQVKRDAEISRAKYYFPRHH